MRLAIIARARSIRLPAVANERKEWHRSTDVALMRRNPVWAEIEFLCKLWLVGNPFYLNWDASSDCNKAPVEPSGQIKANS
jgi:hypothetical protein